MYNYNGARPRSTSSRKLSDNVELPKNYPLPQQNGEISPKTDLLVSVQNLPAVLTDPRKGKENLVNPIEDVLKCVLDCVFSRIF